jgi:hypothetical protein
MDKMKFEDDGSLFINFSSKPEVNNWLYTPEEKMVIAIRVYQPNTEKNWFLCATFISSN